ncbi:metal-dependent transcriptional regulator [candidate division KSB1 bacterium]|nr:metal-dependent transcriptional regulator [candidate division KSB1 bacterium]TDI86113.1 MAG: metal-dependent transcriptional regulator [Caldithrix sp.]
MEVWKAFEQNKITHSAAHHLMTIYDLLHRNGYARVTDVAKNLEITRGSASITLKALKEKGLVTEDENKFLRLSEEGQNISHAIQSMRKIFKKFLVEVLQVDREQAEIDACKIEHLLSRETGEKLLNFMKFLSSDDTDVQHFLQTYRHYESTCSGLPDECEVCDTECLMPDEESEQVSNRT